MEVVACPDCGQKIDLGPQPKLGQEVVCPYCEADLEVISLDPLELDWAYVEPAAEEDDWEDMDDWDDDWDDDDDDDNY